MDSGDEGILALVQLKAHHLSILDRQRVVHQLGGICGAKRVLVVFTAVGGVGLGVPSFGGVAVGLRSIVHLKKTHLLLAGLLLHLVLLLEVLHFAFKLFQKLLYCRLIFPT